MDISSPKDILGSWFTAHSNILQKRSFNSIFKKRTTYYTLVFAMSIFKAKPGSEYNSTSQYNSVIWVLGDVFWKVILYLYKEAEPNLCTLGLRKAKISVTCWDRICLSLGLHKTPKAWLIDLIIMGYIEETSIKSHPHRGWHPYTRVMLQLHIVWYYWQRQLL